MLIHYIRRPTKIGISSKVDCPEESIILESIPKDKLVTFEDLEKLIINYCNKHQEKLPHYSTIKNWVDTLVKKRFVVELHGTKLTKILETL